MSDIPFGQCGRFKRSLGWRLKQRFYWRRLSRRSFRRAITSTGVGLLVRWGKIKICWVMRCCIYEQGTRLARLYSLQCPPLNARLGLFGKALIAACEKKPLKGQRSCLRLEVKWCKPECHRVNITPWVYREFGPLDAYYEDQNWRHSYAKTPSSWGERANHATFAGLAQGMRHLTCGPASLQMVLSALGILSIKADPDAS